MDNIVLYRGLTKIPGMLVPKLAQEFRRLDALHQQTVDEAEKGGGRALDIIKKMGADNLLRWIELAQIAGPQFFTDNKEAAEALAGVDGYVIRLEVNREIAGRHYKGEQRVRSPDGKERPPLSNFVFTGVELGEHLDDPSWRLDVIPRNPSHRETQGSGTLG